MLCGRQPHLALGCKFRYPDSRLQDRARERKYRSFREQQPQHRRYRLARCRRPRRALQRCDRNQPEPGIGQYTNIALRINNCDAIQYGDNHFNNTRIGARFENACLNTFLRANHFTAHQNGILLRSSLNMNDQVHAGNRFFSMTAPDRGAVREFGPETDFFVHTTAAPFWPPNPLPSFGFIIPQSGGSPWTPGLDFCQLTLDPLDDKNDKDIEIAKGEGEGAGALPWMAKKQLYRKLRLHPELLEEAEELEDFKNEQAGAALGLLDAIEEKALQMTNPGTALSIALLDREEEVHAYLAQLQKMESEYLSAPDYENLDELNDYKSSISTLGDSLMDLVLQSRTAILDYRTPLLAQAIIQNAGVSGTDAWISNEKTVNDIYLQTVAQGLSIGTTQLAILSSIAIQCPETDGDAVFKARSLYTGIDWTAFYEADNTCGGNNIQEGSEERSVEKQPTGSPALLQIIPNPTFDIFQVHLSAPEDFEGSIVLRDLSGRTVQKVPVFTTGIVQLIPPSGLSGLFLCQLEGVDGNVLDRQKVIILK